MICTHIICKEHGGCKDDLGRPCINLINENVERCRYCTEHTCNFEPNETFIDYQI